jgi:hypothetical protein
MESPELNVINNIIVKKTVKDRNHEYYMKNRDKLLEKCKIRLQEPENKIKQQEYNKKYLEKNADKYKELKNQKFDCAVCNGSYTYSNFNKHILTEKHLNKIIETKTEI